MKLTRCFSDIHRDCDALFAALEQAARAGDWPRACTLCQQFCTETENHFQIEESRLFPAFEAATGLTRGPTMVMRYEHEQMRELMAELRQQAGDADGAAFAATADTLLVLMQQHNMKEENVLYPMCDSQLPDVDSLLAELGHAAA